MFSKKKLILILTLFLAAGGCGYAFLGIVYYIENRNVVFSGHEAEFYIDASNVLQALSQGDIVQFTRRTVPLNFSEVSPIPSVRWTQSDFYLVADALAKKIHGESLDRWTPVRLIFQTEHCDDATSGLESGSLDFYKIITTTQGDRFIYISVRIYPRYNQIFYRESMHALNDWGAIAMQEATIPADLAFEMAEKSGGKDFRESIDNNCKIDIRLHQSFWKTEWRIEYWTSSPNSDRVFLVDARSGDVTIIK